MFKCVSYLSNTELSIIEFIFRRYWLFYCFSRDTFLVPIINCLTSFYAGFVIFASLGFMAHQKGVSVADVAAGGKPECVFAFDLLLQIHNCFVLHFIWEAINTECGFLIGNTFQFC